MSASILFRCSRVVCEPVFRGSVVHDSLFKRSIFPPSISVGASFRTSAPVEFAAEYKEDLMVLEKPKDRIHFDITTEEHTNTNPTDARNVFPEPMVNEETVKNLTEYEVTNDPKEWEYVLRLLKSPKIPPLPKSLKPGTEMPSGWVVPPDSPPQQLPYFVGRSKDYLYPVELVILNRGQIKRTVLSQIDGDIWGLNEELQEHLQSLAGMRIRTAVRELEMRIIFKGDHVVRIRNWLKAKGF